MKCLLASLTGEALNAFPVLLRYITIASNLKNEILVVQDQSRIPVDEAPRNLPDSIVNFLKESCSINEEEVIGTWRVLRTVIWDAEQYDDSWVRETFALYGRSTATVSTTSPRSLFPPGHLCTNPVCLRGSKGCKMQRVEVRGAVLHTLGNGPIPVNSIHLECTDCKTTYYIDYQECGGKRRYYDTIPDVLQIADHHYAERKLLEFWRQGKATAWLSSSNCAAIYCNLWQTDTLKMPPEWPVKPKLEGQHVTWGFVLISLLFDCARNHVALQVSHTGSQKDRFRQAMIAHNDRIWVYGQAASLHKCTKCVRIFRDESSEPTRMVSAVVMDGVTVGRPRCGEHTCKNGLDSNRDCFCSTHRNLVAECCKTCTEHHHWGAEDMHKRRQGAAWQYAERQKRAQVAHPKNGEAVDKNIGELVEEEDEFEIVFALLVAPCGVIVARKTFYHAESIPSCVEFIKRIYIWRNQPMPNFVIFDNNCTLSKHVKGDPDFKDTGLYVDVFHYTCKHSKSDTFCKENCNPYDCQDLRSDDGQSWFFNTSIAEQTNVWFGGYHSICREMTGDMFDFFLDEMILIRNQATIK
ncbi:hypothetical protein DFP72DRAFT_994429 [Ephemerocybe angulata]|uniref:CxC5 like cysteine cluster associated with KDZ domain-containing protein n=1 Tax=Ephemerocybe angulata TaxID=980116 RepID=A0A8H6H866_9AGAR|nr:hypothetical protein DFP72DRAFT_994429 [Tulosesus angulatus]